MKRGNSLQPERIHRWDRQVFAKALVTVTALEILAILPAILSPWGHAGPETLWGWLGVLLNLPGIFVVGAIATATGSLDTMSGWGPIVSVFVVQVVLFSYVAFVWLRWKKRRVAAYARKEKEIDIR